MKLSRHPVRLVALLAVTIFALVIRYAMRKCTNGDTVLFLVPWYDYIVEHGGFRALRDPFSNYTPPYTYLLVLATYLRPWFSKITAIKAFSVGFDLVAAVVMYYLVRLAHPSGRAPWLAYSAVLLAPTVVINSAVWGQCDVIYTTFLLACVLFACRDKPLLSMLSFAVAFAFKAQAAFLGPFLLVLMLKQRIPWRTILLIPGVYLLMCLPAALAGRPWGDLLGVYLNQSAGYRSLCKSAPNLYALIPDTYYAIGVPVGLAVAAAGVLAMVWAAVRSRAALTTPTLLKAATLSVALMPFLLPKMHDRYFFPADLFSIALAFHCRECRLLPVLTQLTSLAAYCPFLLGGETVPVASAGVVNMVAVGVLVWVYLRALFPATAQPADPSGA